MPTLPCRMRASFVKGFLRENGSGSCLIQIALQVFRHFREYSLPIKMSDLEAHIRRSWDFKCLLHSQMPQVSGFEGTGAVFGHRDDGGGFTDLVKLDDVGGRLAVFDEVDDFDAGSLEVVHEGAGAGGEEGVAEVGGNGDDEAECGGDEALINALGDIGRCGEAV